MSGTYSVSASSQQGGEGHLAIFGRDVRFDAGVERDMEYPGPAELMCAALAACLLKNVERFSKLLSFQYTSAEVNVEAERQDKPPRFVRFKYQLEVVTQESDRRVELLHHNVREFGTVSGTLGQVAQVEGILVARRSTE